MNRQYMINLGPWAMAWEYQEALLVDQQSTKTSHEAVDNYQCIKHTGTDAIISAHILCPALSAPYTTMPVHTKLSLFHIWFLSVTE